MHYIAKYNTLAGEEKDSFNQEYKQHIARKNDAQQSKANDKARATHDDSFVSASFDLQSVLQLPDSTASQMYYSRKLCVYNAAPLNDGFCYCWVEVEGERGRNEIGTCLLQWINALPPPPPPQSQKSSCIPTHVEDKIETKILQQCSCMQLKPVLH